MDALLGSYDASSADEDADSPTVSACHAMETSDGQNDGAEVRWQVKVELRGDLVSRRVLRGEETLEKGLDGWEPEGLIWPTWPGRSQEEFAASVLPLTAVEEYWSASGKRLRDSAKWMATVLGAALAVIVGTSPLSEMTRRINHPAALATGSAGLLFLFVTLFLVIQVMRPQSVSFTDVQFATESCGFWKKVFYGNPLFKWQTIIEREPDLHLPCGVRSLTALRQAMIIEEITLVALSRATVKAVHKPSRQSLCEAEAGRAARLLEMRIAATKIATVGEYYKLLFRSSWATYGGAAFGLLGTVGIIAAFVMP